MLVIHQIVISVILLAKNYIASLKVTLEAPLIYKIHSNSHKYASHYTVFILIKLISASAWDKFKGCMDFFFFTSELLLGTSGN